MLKWDFKICFIQKQVWYLEFVFSVESSHQLVFSI